MLVYVCACVRCSAPLKYDIPHSSFFFPYTFCARNARLLFARYILIFRAGESAYIRRLRKYLREILNSYIMRAERFIHAARGGQIFVRVRRAIFWRHKVLYSCKLSAVG